MKHEQWKYIPHTHHKYMISSFGKVISLVFNRNKVHLRKLFIDKSGYYRVELHRFGYCTPLIHRLVAECFIANPNNYKHVNHKNENRLDNRVSNLEWCTQKYNCNYGNRTLKNYLSALPLQIDNASRVLLDSHDVKLLHRIKYIVLSLNCIK